jgi:hypothetical protein
MQARPVRNTGPTITYLAILRVHSCLSTYACSTPRRSPRLWSLLEQVFFIVHPVIMSRLRSLLASLLYIFPLIVSAAPLERRHGDHGHGGEEKSGHGHTHSFAIKAHGTLLTLAFTFLYPTGVVLIRGGFKRGFLLHWTTQAGATVAALTGMSLMIVKSWERLIVSLSRSLYHLISVINHHNERRI